MLLTPGTGHFFCGSCLRDNALRTALSGLGHEVSMVPLYLPHVLEDEDRALLDQQVHMGGINMYLQQKSRVARKLPRFIERLFDRPGLLRWASRRGNMTDASDLGDLTLSMLRGETGLQKKEVAKLVSWISGRDRPDVIVLSNVMLIGMVRSIRAHVDCKVAVTLQGEQPFLDALSEPFREEAWKVLRERAVDVDLFFPVSDTYGALMKDRLSIESEKMRTVHNGLDLSDFRDEPPALAARKPRTIGYLARMCEDKGLHTLVDAFIDIKTGADRDAVADLRLHVVGVKLGEDRSFVDGLSARLAKHGLDGDVEFSPNATRPDKLAALRSWSLFSVPATYGESFGLYLLEAMVSGIPVVQPKHGAFPEVLEATGGGVLCEPDDAASLAKQLIALLGDEERASALGAAGRTAVLERFGADRMAREVAEHCAR